MNMMLQNQDTLITYWDVGKAPLLRFFKDLQKEEKASFISSGSGSCRGSAKGGRALCSAVVFQDMGSASAGCCLFSPSITKEKAPKVRQLCRRACGAPGEHP